MARILALQVLMVPTVLQVIGSDLYCENMIHLNNQINDFRKEMKSMSAEILELKGKCHPTNSSGVAFTVRFSSDDANVGLPIGKGQILRFDHILTNAGNGYDPLTGIFTAPDSGLYAFYLSVMGIGRHGSLAIEKNGTTLNYVYSKASLDTSDQGSTVVTSRLSLGERVWVREYGLQAVRGSAHTVFSGFLVQGD